MKDCSVLPSDCIERERIAEVIATFRLASWTLIFLFGVVLIAWLAEYFVTGIDLAEWVARRWYIPAGIFVVTAYSYIRTILDRELGWKALRELSSPLDKISCSGKTSLRATGAVIFDQSLIAQMTITCDADGVTIWKRGRREIYLPWDRLEKLYVSAASGQSHYADVQLQWDSGTPPPLRIPWSADMGSFVPSSLR
jgi:hypothetical protein